jgi:FKBP12-rapamycin complex-associated protein
MADYLTFHPKGTSKSLYKAIIDVNAEEYRSAVQRISKAQTLAYDEIQSCLSISPSEAGKTLAKTEYLVELSEVMAYKMQPERRQSILAGWRGRFKQSHPDSNSWLRRLQIWSLACEPRVWELQVCYLDCAKLCESQGKHESAQKIIDLVTPDVTPPVRPPALALQRKESDHTGLQGRVYEVALPVSLRGTLVVEPVR